MVFENVTLIELNLENSRFSTARGGESTEEESYESEDSGMETGSEESSGGSGRSKALPLGLVLFLVVGALAFRRFRSGGEVGDVDDTGGITIEQAAEQ